MKKLLNLCLILASLIGYLEWGTGNKEFLFQTEYDLLFGAKSLMKAIHPFVLIPLGGQLLLLFTLFQKTPSKKLTYIALASLSLLMLFLTFIGITAPNIKILASTIPFLITGVLIIMANRRKVKE
ncbi:MAG: hypothetical protein KDC11_05450 [Chitinophagaceae bacterium]|nr:hypothetical protein [Chitinophagaceae bacterium]